MEKEYEVSANRGLAGQLEEIAMQKAMDYWQEHQDELRDIVDGSLLMEYDELNLELAFRNTNPLVKSPSWDVGLSKTGYIHEAGKCLVMQARVAEKPVVIVLLDSVGKLTRVGDANRIKRWMESAQAARKAPTHATAPAAPPHFSGRVSG